MRTLALALVASLALGGAALAQSPQPSPEPSPSATAAPKAVVVHIKDFAFVPATVTVRAGQTITFVEDDEASHTVTAENKSFDSGYMKQHDRWSHVFTTAGTYPYVCAYHSTMHGTVVVR